MLKTRQPQLRAIAFNSAWLVPIIVLIASLILRVMWIQTDRIVRWDEPDYLILGRNLFTGRGFTVSTTPELHYAPLFPFLAGLLYPITHNMKLNSDILYVLFGTATLVPFYLLARQLFGDRVGRMALVLLALYPPLVVAVLFWGTMLEPLYLFLLYAALFAVWQAYEQERPWAFVAAGAMLGLAYLTKPEAILFLAVALLFLALANLMRRSLFTLRTIGGLVAMAVVFALVIAPYLAFLYRHTGQIMVTGKLGVTYVAGQGAVDRDPGLYDRSLSTLDSTGQEIIWFSPERFEYDIVEIIKADPRAFVYRIWKNVNILESVFFTRKVFPFYLLGFVALALFGSRWNGERAVRELFVIAAALPVLVFLPFHIELRYFAPALPLFVLWVARGIAVLSDWLRDTLAGEGSPGRRALGLASCLSLLLCAGLAAYFVVVQPAVIRDGLSSVSTGRRDVGLWLKHNTSPDALIMSRDTEVPFYAERRWAATPNEEFDRYMSYIRLRGADYVVVDEREITVIRPQLAALLEEDQPPTGLRHAYTGGDAQGKVIVYEVVY